jgi:hypothetical protein
MRRKSKRYITLDTVMPDSLVLSEACQNSLKALAIVVELADRAGFVDLDDLYKDSPEIVVRMCDTAFTALRGLKKLEEREKRRKPTKH